MRKAIIDLGTNTFNLLIADVNGSEFEIVYSEKQGVALGMGGINERRITEDAKERALTTLAEYKHHCGVWKVDQIFAFGTSALRDAKNSNELVNEVREKLDLNIQIISGQEEAELIYKGVIMLDECPQDAIVLDIGGGSSEVLLREGGKLIQAMSLDIGVSRLYQLFKFSDPLEASDMMQIEDFLNEKTAGRLPKGSIKTLIGSSGSFETFYELIHQESFPHEGKMYHIEKEALMEQLERIMASTLRERELNEFIMPIRKIMLPITAVKIKWFIEKMGIEEILVSPYSLKEGALLS